MTPPPRAPPRHATPPPSKVDDTIVDAVRWCMTRPVPSLSQARLLQLLRGTSSKDSAIINEMPAGRSLAHLSATDVQNAIHRLLHQKRLKITVDGVVPGGMPTALGKRARSRSEPRPPAVPATAASTTEPLVSRTPAASSRRRGGADHPDSGAKIARRSSSPTPKMQAFFSKRGGLQKPLPGPHLSTEWQTSRLGRAAAKPQPPAPKASATESGDVMEGLSSEQKAVIKAVRQHHNVFYTGSAGTGKSFLLRRIVRDCQARLGAGGVFVTASTGIAACNIGGITVHSFAGIGHGKEPVEVLLSKLNRNRKALRRWRDAKVLIIDEISMIDGALFDKLATIAVRVRADTRKFGGLQLVVAGDFFQLPPVGLGSGGAKFAFDAKAWPETIGTTIVLTKVFRQADNTFVGVLNELRLGAASKDAIRLIQGAGSQVDARTSAEVKVEATQLFARNMAVDTINKDRVVKLPGDMHRFHANDFGDGNLTKNFQAPAVLELKRGAQVILLKNLDQKLGLVNGSRGAVVDFQRRFDEEAEELSEDALPVVEFALPGDKTARRHLGREEWTVESGGRIIASRSQVPLKLAWALSMHKSQGMTIQKLRVSMKGVFEYGQAYVALSRATSLEGMKVEGFTPGCVRAHPTVKAFYDNLMALHESQRPAKKKAPKPEPPAGAGSKPPAKPASKPPAKPASKPATPTAVPTVCPAGPACTTFTAAHMAEVAHPWLTAGMDMDDLFGDDEEVSGGAAAGAGAPPPSRKLRLEISDE